MPFKKYKTGVAGIAIMIIADILFSMLYVICLFYLRDETAVQYELVNVGSNILLVGISILTTSIISIPMIDVRSKNSLYNTILLEDVLSSPEFYKHLPEAARLNMLHGLEKNLYFGGESIRDNMYESIRRSLTFDKAGKKLTNGIYLESSVYNIKCTIGKDYIEKKIVKTIDVRSYKPMRVKDFPLCRTKAPQLQGISTCELESLEIGRQPVVVDRETTHEDYEIKNDSYSMKSGYNRSREYRLKRKLSLAPDKECIIKICYNTYTPTHDVFYSCRTRYPSHKFNFTYAITGENADKYKLAVAAFGFVDDGKKNPNQHGDESPNIDISFHDWIFPSDGVAVAMLEKD